LTTFIRAALGGSRIGSTGREGVSRQLPSEDENDKHEKQGNIGKLSSLRIDPDHRE